MATLVNTASFPVGAAVNPTTIQNNSAYAAITALEFNSFTAESAMKFDVVEWKQNSFDFTLGDYLVNYAQQHKSRVHGHTLIWQHALPSWVTTFAGDSVAWESIFKNHIQGMVSHYKGKVTSWDVVNEAIRNDNGELVNKDLVPGDGSGNLWRQHLGPDYIARAFQYAHEADTDALLFYNDYGNGAGQAWGDVKLNALIALATNLKNRGIAIAGIGVQMHVDINTDMNNISKALQKMAATGLKIHISELDIAVNPNASLSIAYNDEIQALQANKYQMVAEVYKLAVPVAQQFGITTWEFGDVDSWIPVSYNRKDWPLLFDASYKKKPAYYGFLKGLAASK